jgi:hypothetical protein
VPAPTYATATALTSTPNPSVGGRPITLDARVTAPDGVGTPTGTVRFVDDGRPLGSGPVGGDGRAAITTTAIPGGTHRIVAEYLPTPGSRFLPSATQMTLHVDCYVLDVLCIVRVLLGRPHG